MAITTMNQLVAALPGQHRHIFKANATTEGVGTWHSLWLTAGQPGAGTTPAAGDGAIPTNATSGSIPLVNPGGGNNLYLGRFVASTSTIGTLILYDRLWHNSGFVGNSIAAQAIATPPVLTRPDALGEDVELWGEVYTAMGATASVFTATYTDSTGGGPKSATYSMPANALAVGQMFPFLLAAGDTGVRTVSQVQLSISTGTAGDFGLVLLRRVGELPCSIVNAAVFMDAFSLGMPQLYSGACLALMVLCTAAASGQWQGAVEFIQG